jgi:hypothetical protein
MKKQYKEIAQQGKDKNRERERKKGWMENDIFQSRAHYSPVRHVSYRFLMPLMWFASYSRTDNGFFLTAPLRGVERGMS